MRYRGAETLNSAIDEIVSVFSIPKKSEMKIRMELGRAYKGLVDEITGVSEATDAEFKDLKEPVQIDRGPDWAAWS